MTNDLTASQLAERRRLRDDFEHWAAKAYTIIDKDGTYRKLVLNRAQRCVLDAIIRQEASGRPIRIIILKGRQQGMSTMIEAWQLFKVSQRKAKRAFVLAHVAESSSALFEQAKRGYENLPDQIKPERKRNNKKELIFGRLDSALTVSTASGRGVGRGSTFQYVHASEVAFWEGDADAAWNGLTACVPPVPDSAIFVESTANGIGGLFHRLWTDAERHANEFEAVFVPWFWQPEYRKPVPGGFVRTPEEDYLGGLFGWDDEQVQWRRDRIGTSGLDLFNQEYPNTPQDAFLTSGRPVFDPQSVYKLIQEAPEPVKRLGMVEDRFEEDPRGELAVWAPVDPAGTYYIGADVAEGLKNGDYSVAQVLNGKREQVAVWRGHVLPDAFAHILKALGEMFNQAEVAVELNNHGILTANVLAKQLRYPAVWTDQIYDRIEEEETVRLGFTQNPKTRTMILNKLRADMRDWTITVRDETTLKEMLSFIVNESGKMTAEAGAHDDHVMSLAIANHINEGEWIAISNKPEWYSEAF